ncbi:hypothetical protein [uncultured Proteiniphilum sp.]|uniref:hypothetical protein n=1 Tax=uncultured Proteiniphilum sp. TaxID=497637 RepID=UPI0026347129|nr:hypothetical protein [uncultured Proteiniphilum sp.]
MVKQLALITLGRDSPEVFHLKQYTTMAYKKILIANNFYHNYAEDTIFLRAERREDGTRTFRIKEAMPLSPSYGADIYKRIFY